jgi:hypothetical protein
LCDEGYHSIFQVLYPEEFFFFKKIGEESSYLPDVSPGTNTHAPGPHNPPSVYGPEPPLPFPPSLSRTLFDLKCCVL